MYMSPKPVKKLTRLLTIFFWPCQQPVNLGRRFATTARPGPVAQGDEVPRAAPTGSGCEALARPGRPHNEVATRAAPTGSGGEAAARRGR